MRDLLLAIQILGFATGTILFLWLILLSRKAERFEGHNHNWNLASISGLLWNIGSLAQTAATLFGTSRRSLVCLVSLGVAWTGLAILPTAILLTLEAKHRPKLEKLARYLSFTVAAPLIVSFWISLFRQNFPLSFNSLERIAAYNLAFHVVVYLALFRAKGKQDKRESWLTKATIALLALLAVVLMVLLNTKLQPSVDDVIGVASQQMGIPIAIIALASFSSFRFADVFVKRSLVLLAVVAGALICQLVIVAPLVGSVQSLAKFPTAAGWVATAVLWSTLLLCVPSMSKAISRAVDKWLFQRPDFRAMVQQFATDCELAENEQSLFSLIEERVRGVLRIACVRVIGREEAALSDEDLREEIVYLSAANRARKLLGEAEIEFLIPIRAQSESARFLAIAPGPNGGRLLSDELNFLLTIAERVGRRLETIGFKRERRERELRESNLQRLLTESEIKALRAQINPHFLFNTLNTIADLIGSEPEKAEAMTERLAEVFRFVLAQTEQQMVAVEDEFDFLRTYLEIEQARFGERLKVEIELDRSVASANIPALILQPIVENAIKHGLSSKLEGGLIRIMGASEKDFIRLDVQDDGAGNSGNGLLHAENGDKSLSRKGGVGLRNVQERLKTLYGEHAKIDFQSQNRKGTIVTILIPKDEAQNVDSGRRTGGALALAKASRRAHGN
jgi:two-component system LytT family sensor kinase